MIYQKLQHWDVAEADIRNMKIGKRLKNVLLRFWRESCGPTVTEYAVLLVLIIFGALSAITLMGSFLDTSIRSTTQALPGGMGDGRSNNSGSGSGSDSGSGKSKKPKKPKKNQRGRGKNSPATDHSQNIASISRSLPERLVLVRAINHQ